MSRRITRRRTRGEDNRRRIQPTPLCRVSHDRRGPSGSGDSSQDDRLPVLVLIVVVLVGIIDVRHRVLRDSGTTTGSETLDLARRARRAPREATLDRVRACVRCLFESSNGCAGAASGVEAAGPRGSRDGLVRSLFPRGEPLVVARSPSRAKKKNYK